MESFMLVTLAKVQTGIKKLGFGLQENSDRFFSY